MKVLKVIIVILAIIVATMAILVFTGRFNSSPADEFSRISKQEVTEFTKRLTIQERYEDGTLTIFGAVETPTPCHQVDVASAKTGENTYLVSITSRLSQGEICEQKITDQLFEYSFNVPEDAIIIGGLNGELIEFNRIRIPSDQDFVNPIEYTKG